MTIFICCKNKNEIKKVQDALSKEYKLDCFDSWEEPIDGSDLCVYYSPTTTIYIVTEETFTHRGYTAHLIYVQDTVSGQYIEDVLMPLLKPWVFDTGMFGWKAQALRVQIFHLD